MAISNKESNSEELDSLKAGAAVEEIVEKTLAAPGLEIPDSRFEDWFPKMPKEQHEILHNITIGTRAY
ncbi:hypothetical protein V1498_10515 [Peribacillus sp. SCS-26]|uniref:hypothetical protein n=1 Tax=Paraperibacillus marinus TaxID=3115295 RepID=UPI00390612A5